MPDPFPELAPYAEPRRVVPRGEVEGWLAEEMRKERDREVRRTIVTAPPPDQVARETRLAREANVAPAMIEGRLDEVERSRNADKLTALAERYPALGKFTSLNPRAAVAAQDDTESLGVLGSAWDMLTKVPARMGAGSIDAVAGLFEDVGGFVATPGVAGELQRQTLNVLGRTFANRLRPEAETIREANRGNNWMTDSALSGIEYVPATIAAVTTRNPNVAAGILGLSVRGNALAEGREQGLTGTKLQTYGAIQGGIEFATEKIPAGILVDLIARKTPWGKAFVRELGQEMKGEQIATLTQDLTDWAMLPENEGKTFGDYLAERPSAAAQTAFAVAGGTTATTGIIGAAQRATDATAKVADRVGLARQAKREGQFFDKAAKAAEQSKLRGRDPEAWRELVRAQALESGATSAYISPDAIRAFQQSDAYDQDNDPFDAQRFAEAEAAGGDYVIPVADLLTDVVGTPAWEAVKDQVRLTGGGMSPAEAAQFEESMAEIMAEAGDAFAAQDKAAAKEKSVREKLVDQVATAFGVSFGSRAARDIAEIFAQRAQTRAARLGQELSPEAAEGFEVRQVMPEGVAQAVKADRLDLVINAMRQGKDAEQGVGQSLMEFIASRGGINDTGGDLASIGVPAKLLRDTAQASFGGLSGAGDFGLDTTLRAAIESGFFPNLAELENEAGTSQLDVQVLIDALAEEAGGRPVFAETRVDDVRASAADLRAMLSEAGYSPDEMSDAEVRAVVEGMASEETEGRAYNQPAFHGSPHIFDRFSLDAIGTGEGAQAYGHGLYFAGRKEIAEFYRRKLAGNVYYDNTDYAEYFTPGRIVNGYGGRDKVISFNPGPDGQPWDWTVTVRRVDADGEFIESERSRTHSTRPNNDEMRRVLGRDPANMPGRLYEVEIPEDNEYLLWDKPLEYQDGKREVLLALADKIGGKAGAELRDDLQRDGTTGERVYRTLSKYLFEDMPPAERLHLNGRNDQAASDLLHEAGIAGIKYLDGGSRTAGDGSFNYVVFDENRVAIRAYEQEYGEGARGRIIFDQNRRIIEMFAGRNLSTPIHEFSHMWLEELRHDGETGGNAQVFADWEAVKAWFKRNGHALGEDGVIPVEAHEMFARAGERYIMEGKAPTTGLQRIFETFRNALVAIYKTVDALRAPITPEIREVFDRLLATDEEIAAARERQNLAALFKDAASIGMSQAEFAAYQAEADAATGEAHAKLLDKAMRTIRHREQRRYAEARKTIRAEEEQRIDNAPLHKALRLMRDTRISKRWIVDEMGEDALGLLPVRVPPIYSDGGVDPNIIAELAGYGGAADMIESLIGAERAQREAKEGGDKRGMRQRAIENATDAEFARRYGDPFSDGTIEQEALAAVYSERQGELMASEIRVLGRKTGQRPTPWKLARDWARGKIRAGSWADEASPSAIQRYARNAAKAQRAAEEAFIAQDFTEAYRQKQFAMLNTALVSEAKNAAEEIESAVKRMEKIAGRKTMKSVDQDYLEQAHALLEAVDLKRRSQAGIDRARKWEAWAAQREAEGHTVVMPERFAGMAGNENWSRLPIDDVLTLDEQVKQIMHLGRVKQELLTAKAERELAVVTSAIQDTIREQRPEVIKDWRHRNTLGQRLRSGVRELFAVHRKMASLARQIDGGRDGGPLVKAFILPMTDRYNWEAEQHTAANLKLSEILKPFLGRTATGRNKMTSGELYLPSLNQSFNLEERMIIVANMGNAGNLQRLLDGEQVEDGFNWSMDDLNTIRDSLTKEQMDAVQAIWDLFESYKPLIAEKEKRVNGVEPDWVEPQPVETPHGTYRGGYFPIKYDPARSTRAQQQADADDAKRQMQGAFTATTTRRSFIKERADKVEQRPLRYSFSTATSGITEVIHDLAFHEYLIDANRLLRHRKVGGEIRKRFGPEVLKQFTEGIEDVAVGNAPAANAWEAALNHVRFGATIAGLGWNLKTAMLQPFGITQSIVRVGPKWIARGLREWTTYPAELPRRVREKSAFMRERSRTMNREVNEIQNRVQGRTASRQFMEASFFYMIVKMQMTVDIPTWWGAYEKAIAADETEVEAVLLADQAVKDAQGGGQIGDLARIQRGGPLMKLWTNFYSFFSTTFNLTAESIARTKFTRPGDVVAFMSDMVLLYSIPAMMGVALDAAFDAMGGDDDDEENLIARLAGEQISYAMGTMVGLREMTGFGQSVAEWISGEDVRKFDGAYGGPAGLRALQELDRLGQQAAQGELDHALRKSAINAAGVLLHLPSGQINKSLDGAMALEEGDSENPLVLATGT